VPVDSVTPERARAIQLTSPQVAQARQIFLELASQGATPSAIAEGLESLEGQLQRSLNPDFNPRTIVGDDYANTAQRNYGNSDVMGPFANHGTHLAGIIGAVRGNNIGIDGVAPAVKLMMIRVVPDGDERDKDIANAIRYAVDHGARVINMSFGKGYSPYKSAVDDAVKYADAKGVLMIHAAGNDGADLAAGHNFPTPEFLGGGRAQNWIEVGASSWKGGDRLVASFSNYGSKLVDVFAPGEDILSTVPGSKYERESGTSMAAPVVTGLSALLMAYYPDLSAADIRKIILASVTKLSGQTVAQPHPEGQPGKNVPFGTLSVTGGIVNAYNAVRIAEEMSAKARP
jgi:subtilisin family serine protease